MNEYISLGIYLLGFIAFSYVMYAQNKLVKIQRKMLAEDMDVLRRSQDSLTHIVDICCKIIDNPDKYPEEIKALKEGRDNLKKFDEKLKKESV